MATLKAYYNGSWYKASIIGTSDHGALSGLSDDDHTQYLLTDGTRALTGSFNLGSTSRLFTNGSGDTSILFTGTSSAVNYLNLIASTAGNSPIILAAGSDTNLDLSLLAKGSGVVKAGGIEVVTLSATQTLTNKTLTTPTIASFTNATHDHSNAAGGGTISAANLTGTLSGARLADKHKQVLPIGHLESPAASDEFPIARVWDACTIEEIEAETDTGTCTLNVEKRAYGSAFSAGTDAMSSDLVADAGGQAGTVTSGSVSADTVLVATVTSVASTPGYVNVYVRVTVDD